MFVVDAEQQLPQPAVVTATATGTAPTTETSTVSLAPAVVDKKSKAWDFFYSAAVVETTDLKTYTWELYVHKQPTLQT